MWTDSCTFCCDWLNVVVDYPNIGTFLQSFSAVMNVSVDSWQPCDKGLHFYSRSFRLQNTDKVQVGKNSIVLSFSPIDSFGRLSESYSKEHPQHGILISFSGDGLRYLRSVLNREFEVFSFIRSLPHSVTRIDLAMDIFDSKNPIVTLFQSFAETAYNPERGDLGITGIKRPAGFCTISPVFDYDEKCYTNNIQIGERTSTKGHALLYNKKEELRQGRLSDLAQIYYDSVGASSSVYWWRLEYRGKGELAQTAFENLFTDTYAKLNDVAAFYTLVDNLFSFIVLKYLDNHYSDGDTCFLWQSFLDWLLLAKSIYFVEYRKSKMPYVAYSAKKEMQLAETYIHLLAFFEKIRIYSPQLYDYYLSRGNNVYSSRGITDDELILHLEQNSLFENILI